MRLGLRLGIGLICRYGCRCCGGVAIVQIQCCTAIDSTLTGSEERERERRVTRWAKAVTVLILCAALPITHRQVPTRISNPYHTLLQRAIKR